MKSIYDTVIEYLLRHENFTIGARFETTKATSSWLLFIESKYNEFIGEELKKRNVEGFEVSKNGRIIVHVLNPENGLKAKDITYIGGYLPESIETLLLRLRDLIEEIINTIIEIENREKTEETKQEIEKETKEVEND